MGTTFQIVNRTKREHILFSHIPASKQRELAGHPAASAIATWYLMENRGDEVAFVSDLDDDWPFDRGSYAEVESYTEVTDRTVEQLIAAGILQDYGVLWADEDEPETVFDRDLRNVW